MRRDNNQAERELSEEDQNNMDVYLGRVLDAFKSGATSKDQTMAELAHCMTALGNGDFAEVRNTFERLNNNLTAHPE